MAARVRGIGEELRLWYESDQVEIAPSTMDWALVALTPWAMATGRDMHIDGRVRVSQLSNLEEYQDAWALWLPGSFKKVALTAAEVSDDEIATTNSAVAAYSGGLDSSYLIASEHDGLLGQRSSRIARAVMVHGFDMPVDDPEGFKVALARGSSALGSLGLDLVGLRTNWRQFSPNWEMTFGAGVASVLHLFDDMADRGLWAADTPYHLADPVWGSNPLTNNLLGNATFPIESVGFGTTRSAKASVVARYPALMNSLRVCWAGKRPGENCGVCEKCVRTKLNFLAVGAGHLSSLGPVTTEQVRSIKTRNSRQLELLRDIPEERLPQELGQALRRVIRRENWRIWSGDPITRFKVETWKALAAVKKRAKR